MLLAVVHLPSWGRLLRYTNNRSGVVLRLGSLTFSESYAIHDAIQMQYKVQYRALFSYAIAIR